jgi:NAD(P)-dependent dehydrogenase (short-subunit alcohol dehydrogenase family)
MRGLNGKGVLVSGGSRGIGQAAVQRFLEEGCRVFFCGVNAGEVEQTLQALGALGPLQGIACDVSQPQEAARLVDYAAAWLGGIDVLVNNAGIAWQEPFVDIKPENWERILAVNLEGMFLVAQAAARHMIARGRGGAIVNMSSTNGLVGEALYAHYNASKAGILTLTKTMAIELGKHGIRVNALCPGYILTPLTESLDDPGFVAAYVREKIPIGRAGKPADVAAAYAFLASDEAAFIHGAELVIDGGQLTF